MITAKHILLFFLACLGTVFIKAQIPNYVPLSGLQAYWPFTGNANDLGANSYNGTVNGATPATDRFGNTNSAYSFNGTSDYILTSYAGILGANARAVSFWAKTTQSSVPFYLIGWGSNQTGGRFGIGFSSSPANGIGVGGANIDIVYNTPISVSGGVWHHYVVQFNATLFNQIEIYQDAVLLSQVSYSLAANSPVNTQSSFNVQFGRIDYSPAPQYFDGQLDDIGIWDRTLSLCEIMQLYTSSLTAISVTGSGTIICAGQPATLTATGAGSYTWNTNSNAASITVTPASTTSYSVSGSTAGCSSSANITVSVAICTGIDYLSDQSSGFTLFPNPTCGIIALSEILEASRIDVYSALGQVIYSKKITREEVEVDLSHQPAGIYVVRIESKNGPVTRKIIKE